MLLTEELKRNSDVDSQPQHNSDYSTSATKVRLINSNPTSITTNQLNHHREVVCSSESEYINENSLNNHNKSYPSTSATSATTTTTADTNNHLINNYENISPTLTSNNKGEFVVHESQSSNGATTYTLIAKEIRSANTNDAANYENLNAINNFKEQIFISRQSPRNITVESSTNRNSSSQTPPTANSNSNRSSSTSNGTQVPTKPRTIITLPHLIGSGIKTTVSPNQSGANTANNYSPNRQQQHQHQFLTSSTPTSAKTPIIIRERIDSGAAYANRSPPSSAISIKTSAYANHNNIHVSNNNQNNNSPPGNDSSSPSSSSPTTTISEQNPVYATAKPPHTVIFSSSSNGSAGSGNRPIRSGNMIVTNGSTPLKNLIQNKITLNANLG